MNNKKIIALVGLAGSGKSALGEYFKKKNCFLIYFGKLTLEEIKKRCLEINPENEKLVREEIRAKYGMGAYATLAIPKIEQAIANDQNIVIDGLYSLSEYLILREKYGAKLFLIASFTPKEIRYQRLCSRPIRPLSRKEVDNRDYAEIVNIEKAGPIALADYTIINDESSISALHEKLELIIKDYGLL